VVTRAKRAKRISTIDLLRFMAALMVATNHWSLEVGSERAQQIYDIPILGRLVQDGAFGVPIFFMISGFVIIGAAQRYNSVEFIFARFNRLFPGLVICMLIILPVGDRFVTSWPTPIPSFFNSIFLTWTVTGTSPLASQLWTLLVEIKFYALVAFVLLLSTKLLKEVRGIILMLSLWQTTLLILQNTQTEFSAALIPYLNFQGHSNLFATGICIYLLTEAKIKFTDENLLICLATLYFLYQIFVIGSYSFIQNTYLITVSLLILFSKYLNLGKRFQLISYWLGLSSYLIYLLHEHLGLAFILQIRTHISQNIYIVFVLGSISITVFSVLLATLVEKPTQKYLTNQFAKVYPR
jgi:peptidoglycan/LPS O-acetylase OafA/YrhL